METRLPVALVYASHTVIFYVLTSKMQATNIQHPLNKRI